MIHSRTLRYLILAVAAAMLPAHIAAQDALALPSMRDVFVNMPDSIIPTVTRNNRLDCVDFIENNLEAKVRNTFDEYVTLEALTTDYARFRTSASAVMEMKLLPGTDSTAVLCVVTTVTTSEPDSLLRLSDSSVRMFAADWTPLPDSMQLHLSFDSSYYLQPAGETADSTAEAALRDFHPISLSLSASQATLTATLQTASLTKAEREAIAPRLRQRTLRWNGRKFL